MDPTPQASSVPAPPPGFVPESAGASSSPQGTQSATAPAPPPGFVPESQGGVSQQEMGTGIAGNLLHAAGIPDTSLTTGFAKGMGESAHTIGRLINGLTRDNVSWLPKSTEQPKELESSNFGESVGKIGESIAEFALGDSALKGLSIAEKLNTAHQITELAQKSPFLAKLVSLGVKSLQGAATGGVVGGLHGGAEGAETGAVAGAVAEPVAAGVSKVAKAAKSVLFPSEEVSSQVTKDLIKRTLGSKVDADVADELASRVNKQSFLSPMENELKLAKASLEKDIPEYTKQLDDTLARNTEQAGNTARLVNETFTQQAKKTLASVGTGKSESIDAINKVRQEVLSKLSDKPMTAQAINDVKRLVGDEIPKFASPEHLTTAQADAKESYRQAYFKLRDIVDQLSPETKELNAKISSGINARDVLRQHFPQLETPEQAIASHAGAKTEALKSTVKTVGKNVAKYGAVPAAAGAAYEVLK